MFVIGRSSSTESLYDVTESSMDELGHSFQPVDATGFIAVHAIRLKKFGDQKKN